MRRVALAAAAAAFAVAGFSVATAVVSRASAHTSPCHTQHTCPSDHHTYVWTDPTTGLAWDCAEPGAPEYDPARDTTVIVWDGRTYFCRPAAAAPGTTGATATGTTVPETSTASTAAATTTVATTTTAPTSMQPERVLPNPSLTPGAYNPKVRQTTIRRTICRRGWTKKIRPPVSYTNALKAKQMAQYGETGSPSLYEEDHLIPLELGGAPSNPKNLWPEPHTQSKVSDPLETKLKRMVCRRSLTLATARVEIRVFKFANG